MRIEPPNTLLDAYTPEDLQNFVRHCWTAGTRASVDSYITCGPSWTSSSVIPSWSAGSNVSRAGGHFRDATPHRKHLPGMLVLGDRVQPRQGKFIRQETVPGGSGEPGISNLPHRCPGHVSVHPFPREGGVAESSFTRGLGSKLLRGGSNREHELNDKTHRTWTRNVMNVVGIVSSRGTYADRKTGAQQAKILGVPEAE
jgi:hypothetical protein